VTCDDVIHWFLHAAINISRGLEATWVGSLPAGPVTVIHKDILKVTSADIGRGVSLVVTSPPYPNAYEYWLYHKYRMYWLGMDPLAVRTDEIGARLHYFKAKPQTAVDFERQMNAVFALLAEVVVPDGHACFQVGDSVIRGDKIDNTDLFRRVAGGNGFDEVASMTRSIPRNRKAFNLHHARINEERILVFRRREA
jgi:DNA modification methylase